MSFNGIFKNLGENPEDLDKIQHVWDLKWWSPFHFIDKDDEYKGKNEILLNKSSWAQYYREECLLRIWQFKAILDEYLRPH